MKTKCIPIAPNFIRLHALASLTRIEPKHVYITSEFIRMEAKHMSITSN